MYEYGVSIHMALDLRKPVETRRGAPVRIYYVYKDYMHGAYEIDNWWWMATWTVQGFYIGKQHKDDLDLKNVD